MDEADLRRAKVAEDLVLTRTSLAMPIEMMEIVIVVETKDVEIGTMGNGETKEMKGLDKERGGVKIIEILEGVEVQNETQGIATEMFIVDGNSSTTRSILRIEAQGTAFAWKEYVSAGMLSRSEPTRRLAVFSVPASFR